MNCPPVEPVAANVSLDNFKSRMQDFIDNSNSFLQNSEDLETKTDQELQTLVSTGKDLLCEHQALGDAVGDLSDHEIYIDDIMPEQYEEALALDYHIQMRVNAIQEAVSTRTTAAAPAAGGARKKTRSKRSKVRKTKTRKGRKGRKTRKAKGKN